MDTTTAVTATEDITDDGDDDDGWLCLQLFTKEC